MRSFRKPVLLVVIALSSVVMAASAQAHALRPPKHPTSAQRIAFERRVIQHDRYTIQWYEQNAGETLYATRTVPRSTRVLYGSTIDEFAPRSLTLTKRVTDQRVRKIAWRDLRFHVRQKHNFTRLLKKNLAALRPLFPPHHRLWLCIHGGEGAWNDPNSGNNGHWGGLQMHPGWGYGTAYHASDSTQFVQEWAAEKGYIASRYSHAWLQQQWGATIGPCWGYA